MSGFWRGQLTGGDGPAGMAAVTLAFLLPSGPGMFIPPGALIPAYCWRSGYTGPKYPKI